MLDPKSSEASSNDAPSKHGETGSNLNSSLENGDQHLSKMSDQALTSNDQSDKEKDRPPLDDASSKPKQDETIEDNSRVNLHEEKLEAKFISAPLSEQLTMVKEAIKSGFLRIDQNMRVAAQDASGCTAVCAFVSPTHIFIANCGDSRAVFYSGTSLSFVTEDHKPFNPTERKRIIDAGGTATQRINGTLAVSRALGDFESKKDNLRGPCEQLVSPEPEVTIIERNPKDEFLVLACDGIWDVMNNDDLCQFIRHKLIIEPDLENVCSSVLDLCLNKGSRDNMSIIIVVFETAPKVRTCFVRGLRRILELRLRMNKSKKNQTKTVNI